MMEHQKYLNELAEVTEDDGFPEDAEKLREAAREIERLQAFVEKLPKCWRLDEGKLVQDSPVVPCMFVWSWIDVPYLHGDSERIRKELERYQVGGVRRVTFEVVNQHNVHVGSLAGQNCYSTEAAAQAAEEET